MNKFGSGIHVLVKNDDGKYLVMRRKLNDDSDAGNWDFPGGGIHLGEQPFETAIRETLEETGMNIKLIRPLTQYALQYGETWSTESIVLAETNDKDVKLSEEHTEFKWVPWEELKDIEPKGTHLKAIEGLSLS